MKKLMMLLKKRRAREEGFTLVELMVVLAIIALLTTAVVLNVVPAQGKAMTQKARADIRMLEQAVEMYRLDMMDYPDEQVGLGALRSLPSGVGNPDNYRAGGYVSTLPNDPWGRPYIYIYPGENGVFDIASYGADGEPGGEELNADIVSWEP